MSGKKYLLRAAQKPFEICPYDKLYYRIDTNVGNLVYVAGAVRGLMVSDDVEFDRIKRKDYTDEDIDNINQTCDAFIITLADALRAEFEEKLNRMTDMIKRLTIPCVVVGCGLKADYEPGADLSFCFDDSAKAFFSAVLDHSAKVGLRGQITADYLKHLGFKEETDYTVIGCPSMYMWGAELPYRDTVSDVLDSADAPLSFNISPAVTPRTYELISKMAADYRNAVYIPQNKLDEVMMYYGVPINPGSRPANWPVSLDHPFYSEHEARFFNSPENWIEFQKTRSLSFGTRVHGNITGVLAGTPALFLPQGARQRELCDYHGFTNIPPQDLEKIDDLRDVIPKLDFSKHLSVHKRNFDHYLDFLRENELDNIFEHPEITEAPYDKKAEPRKSVPGLRQVSLESEKIQKQRLQEWEDRDKPKSSKKPLSARIKRKLKNIFG